MTNVSMPGEASPLDGLPAQGAPRLLAAWQLTSQHFARNDFAAAAAVARAIVAELADSSVATMDDGVATGAWRAAFEALTAYLEGATKLFARDYQGASRSYQDAFALAQKTSGMAWPEQHVLPKPVMHLGVVSAVRMPLCQAAEAVAVGDGAGALKHVGHAEAVVAQAVDVLDQLCARELAASLSEAQWLEAAGAFDIYAIFYTDAVPLYTAITAHAVDLAGARAFFERHEHRFAAITAPGHPLGERMAQVYPVLPALAGFTAAQRLLVEARLVAENAGAQVDVEARPPLYEEALAALTRAQAALRRAATSLPGTDPLSARLRETCVNAATSLVPQVERQLRREMALNEQLRVLAARERDLGDRLEQAFAEQRGTMIELVRLLSSERGVNIDITNVAEAKAQLQAHVEISNRVHDAAVDEIARHVRELRDHLPATQAEELDARIADARRPADILAKAERVAALLDTLQRAVETTADLVPYGRTVYRVLRGIFG